MGLSASHSTLRSGNSGVVSYNLRCLVVIDDLSLPLFQAQPITHILFFSDRNDYF